MRRPHPPAPQCPLHASRQVDTALSPPWPDGPHRSRRMRQQRGRAHRPFTRSRCEAMLEAAKRLIVPSRRSDVPAFMVMDVMAAAARLEAAGARVIHMEVGQPAAAAPASAIVAARAALDGRIAYTESLGIPSLRVRIARHYAESYGIEVDPARIIVTTG